MNVDQASTSRSNSIKRPFEVFTISIYPGHLSEDTIAWPVQATIETKAECIVNVLVEKLQLNRSTGYVLAEVRASGGEEWILDPGECPVQRMMLWPRTALNPSTRKLEKGEKASSVQPDPPEYRFLLREKCTDGSIHYKHSSAWLQEREERRMEERGFLPHRANDTDDLCTLPELSEDAILVNLRTRFMRCQIYTYAGSILVAINPFRFLPIYNPRYVQLYAGRRLGELEPHIFAVADAAYHSMLRERSHQCLVITGESGSGKTQSTNFLIHHLTALSQRGYTSGVERTILGAGPVLEAFGNAKTAHNNNSSRFGKFIQVNYWDNGTVRGAVVEKYLLEKSRLVSQEKRERNYHVFYYLLAGMSEEEKAALHLSHPSAYTYLTHERHGQPNINGQDAAEMDWGTGDSEELKHDYERLKLAMEMVGFLPETCKQIFTVISAILSLGNISFRLKSVREEAVEVDGPEAITIVSKLLKVEESMLYEALTSRKAVAVDERLILPLRLSEAITARNSMAKSLYSALFDWIVLRINLALLNKKDLGERVECLSIGVLDIFGFEDVCNGNSFEQFCINFANERLQYYFNQHIFKMEQEEYVNEGIAWHPIDFVDNLGCIMLIAKKPTGLFHLLDEECNFPQANNETLLAKFRKQHEGNRYLKLPAVMEPAFTIRHFAGKVKYNIKDFREKNMDHMRPDVIALLRSSRNWFVRGLISIDPVALFRWATIRAFFQAVSRFRAAGRHQKERRAAEPMKRNAGPTQTQVATKGFSFLMHPVHQRSLQVLQRYRESHSIDQKNFQRAISAGSSIDSGTSCSTSGEFQRCLSSEEQSPTGQFLSQGSEEDVFLFPSSSRQRDRTTSVLLRNRGQAKLRINLPKHLLDVRSLKHIANQTLHDHTTKSLLHLHTKKRPPSISAQFQASLNKLLEMLRHAKPYFIRCLRSNSKKDPMGFDHDLVLRQLRYTDMLETVRITRSGYSTKYSFQAFKEKFGLLLPSDAEATGEEIATLLKNLHIDPDNHQIGKSKVFLREKERLQLFNVLHNEVLQRICLIQSWYRATAARRLFLRQRQAIQCLQHCVHSWLERRRLAKLLTAMHAGIDLWANGATQLRLHIATVVNACLLSLADQKRTVVTADVATQLRAAITLQAAWRAHRQRNAYLEMVQAAICLQTAWRERGRQLELRRRNKAAVIVQAWWKMCYARRHVQAMYAALSAVQNSFPSQIVLNRQQEQDVCMKVDIKASVFKQAKTDAPEEIPNDSRAEQQIAKSNFSAGIFAILEGVEENSSSKANVETQREVQWEDRPEETIKQHLLIASNSSIEGKSVAPCTEDDDIAVAEQSQAKPVLLSNDIIEKQATECLSEMDRELALELNESLSLDENEDYEQANSDHLNRKDATNAKSFLHQRENSLLDSGELVLESTNQLDSLGVSDLPQVQQKLSGDEVEALLRMLTIKQENLDSEWKAHHIPGLHLQHFNLMLPTRPARSRDGRSPLKSRFRNLLNSRRQVDKKVVKGSLRSRSALKGFIDSTMLSTNSLLEPSKHGQTRRWSHGVVTSSQALVESQVVPEATKPLDTVQPTGISRKRSIRISREASASAQWEHSTGKRTVSSSDLHHLNDFLLQKINGLLSSKIQSSNIVDQLFKKALQRFQENIHTMCLPLPGGALQTLQYKDLLENFESVLTQVIRQEANGGSLPPFPIPFGLNTIKVFLDEFVRGSRSEDSCPSKVPKLDRKKMRNKKEAEYVVKHRGHLFRSMQFNIPTSCEHCKAFMWMMDRGYVCKLCKYTCHKKCCSLVIVHCHGSFISTRKGEVEVTSRQFGVPLTMLAGEDGTVPLMVEKLFRYVELCGLYTEGLYRKCGSANKARELREELDADVNGVILDTYQVHVVASVLKQWLRDLPDPLMTYEHYYDFLRAVELPERKEQLRCIYSIIEKLPQVHVNLLERLVFHFVRVAQHEESNRMSPNALAIVLAPCVLRCPDSADPLSGVKEITKATACVEIILTEHLEKVVSSLATLDELNKAEEDAINRLSFLRRSLDLSFGNSTETHENSAKALDMMVVKDMLVEQHDLEEELRIIQDDKEELTLRMVMLEPLVSDDEGGSVGNTDSSESLLDECTSILSPTLSSWVIGASVPVMLRVSSSVRRSRAGRHSLATVAALMEREKERREEEKTSWRHSQPILDDNSEIPYIDEGSSFEH
uniref:unconventional myosin-IXa-like isoform X3 n=1 Tax=Myxine glutinosa TaxID=7769 RepID=UPI00358DF983